MESRSERATDLTCRVNIEFFWRLLLRFLALLKEGACMLWLFLVALSLAAQEFRQVEPELLSRTTPKVDPNADAEAVFWEVTLIEGSNVELDHYVRVEIYTELGRERHGRVDLIIPNKTSIWDVEGRTIRTDGSVVPLDRSAVFEREVIKLNKIKLKAVSFAMPTIEAGAVLKYKWREKRSGSSLHYQRLDLQREMPVWSVTYRIKPLQRDYATLGLTPFQLVNVGFVPDERKGFQRLTVENLPAFEEEPHSPPEDAVRSWILLEYRSSLGMENPVQAAQAEFLSKTKPDSEIVRLSKELIAGIDDPPGKLDKLAEYCRIRVRNLSYEPKATPSERERASKLKDAGDVLAAKMGMGWHVNLLFAALARAAGFQVFLANLPERDRIVGRSANHLAFRSATNIAVKVENRFLFFDPATPFVENRMLRWQEEGVPATFADSAQVLPSIYTPWSKADRSRIERGAELKLSPDGAVEGEVRITYTGHPGVVHKLAWFQLSREEIQEEVKQEVTGRLPMADVADIVVENTGDAAKPLTVRYRIRVPHLADRAGGRLFLPVAFFQQGLPSRFQTSIRKNPIYFPYAWTETDDVVYTLAGSLEPGELIDPAGLNIGKTGTYRASIEHAYGTDTVRYRRSFTFVADGQVGYPPDYYPSLKSIFERVHACDAHRVEIRRAVAATTNRKEQAK